MASKKKNSYVDKPLEWLKSKCEEMQKYIDDRPFHELEDRKGYRPTAKGGMIEYVIASIEQQRADLEKAIIGVSQILAAIKELEAAEEKKAIATRGDEELTPLESGILDEEDDQ